MSSATLLLVAAVLTFAVGMAHSFLGEKYILIRLFRRSDLPKLLGDTTFTVRTLRFAWHLTTVAWCGFGAMLWLGSRDELSAENTLMVLAVTMLVTAVTVLVASRGRHLAWPVFTAIAFAAFYAPSATAQDHPLLSAYSGSVIQKRNVEEYGEYQLVTGRNAKGELTGEALQGKLTRIVYQNPAERSTLEIFRNYQQALTGAGMTTIYSCAIDECGPAYARSAWGRYNGLFTASDGDPRYIAGKIATDKGTAYVAIMVGRQRSQVDVIEITGMQQGMVGVDAAALGQGLDRDGRVSVYGIYFDTDKSEVKPESKAAIGEIAALLKARLALKLYVVGHTDLTGALAHNRALSEARARAVVAMLVDGHGIAATRLEGHGVGPLAPVASNADETGRAKNRRVELVAR